MSGPKTKTQQSTSQSQSGTSTSTVGNTPDIEAARGFQFRPSPRLPNIFAAAQQRLANSFNNPIGGAYSPNMRDALKRSSQRSFAQQGAQAESEANADLQSQQYAQKYSLASLTAPRTSNYSGQATGTGTATQQTNPGVMDFVGMGLTGAAM